MKHRMHRRNVDTLDIGWLCTSVLRFGGFIVPKHTRTLLTVLSLCVYVRVCEHAIGWPMHVYVHTDLCIRDPV